MSMDDDETKAMESRLIANGWADKPDQEPLTPADCEWFWYGTDWWIVHIKTGNLLVRGCELIELQHAVRRLKQNHGLTVRRNRSRDTARGPSPVAERR